MVYPYMVLADGTEIVHTQVFEEDGLQKVEVHFERPTEDGFDTARCQLPSYTWLIKEGFSENEMKLFDQRMRTNAHLFINTEQMGVYRLVTHYFLSAIIKYCPPKGHQVSHFSRLTNKLKTPFLGKNTL